MILELSFKFPELKTPFYTFLFQLKKKRLTNLNDALLRLMMRVDSLCSSTNCYVLEFLDLWFRFQIRIQSDSEFKFKVLTKMFRFVLVETSIPE